MRRNLTQRMLILAILVGSVLFTPASAVAAYITGSQNVAGNRNTPQYTTGGKTYGPFAWNFSYTRSFDGKDVSKHLEIDFAFDAALNYTAAQKAAYRAAAETNIEGVWNNKFFISDGVGGTFGVKVDVTTTGPTFNQTVAVHPGNGAMDMTNWYVAEVPTASVQAHEFGHMLGLFDEYIGGAVDQFPNPTITDTGLMGLGARLANPDMFPRYYQQYVDYMNTLNPGNNFRLNPIPVPPTMILAFIGSGVCLLYKRRRGGRQLAVADQHEAKAA